jgi:hypothetical protein
MRVAAAIACRDGKTCPLALGTVCRSTRAAQPRALGNSHDIKCLRIAPVMACGLLIRPRDHSDNAMIAQTILTNANAAKTAATQQPQPPSSTNGFLALLSTTDSALTDLAQNTGAVASSVQAAANANKPSKATDASATPYVAAAASAITPSSPAGSTATPSGGNQSSVNANAVPGNSGLPGTTAANGQAAAAQSGAGNSTGFGADQLNARVAAGAPIFASQPSAAMATLPAHLLDAAAVHPQPEAGAAKPGDDATPKPATETGALPASAANTTSATAPLLPAHPATTNDSGNGAASANDSAAPAAASGAAGDAGNSAAANASLATQPNAPAATPVQLDAAVHAAAPYVPVGEQVALNLKQALTSDNNEIRIQLKPASLGTIDVKVNLTQDGRVSAVISADRSDTLNMLKQDSGTLQQALRDAGLNTDSNSLSFNLRGDAQSFAQNSSQGGSGQSGAGSYLSAGGDALIGAEAIAPAQRSHAGALDIEV